MQCNQRRQAYIKSRVRGLQLLNWEEPFPAASEQQERSFSAPAGIESLASTNPADYLITCSAVHLIAHTKSKNKSPVTAEFNQMLTQTTGKKASLQSE